MLHFDALLLLIGVVTAFLFFLKRTYSYWDRKGINTIPGFYYLTGHFKFDFGRKPVANIFLDLYNASKEPFAGCYFLLRPRFFVRDPELIRSILIKDFQYFPDRVIFFNEKNDPLTGHLFALGATKWNKLRPKLTPTFTSGKLKAMFPTLIGCGSTLQNYLEKLTDKGDLLDVKEISACYATNVIASVAFGIELDTINNPNNEFRVVGRNVVNPTFLVALKIMLLNNLPKLMYPLGFKFVDSEVEHFILSIVKQNLEYREKNNIFRKDFFQLLIQLRNTGTVQLDDDWETEVKKNENEKMMTLPEMAAQVFIFFVAGFETSSSTLSFCLYELAKNPDVQQRVHDEIDAVLAKHNGQMTYESVSEIKLLESCIDETLRLYPSLPFINRVCAQDYRLPGTDKIIEKGMNLSISVIGLHRDEKYYHEPNRFNPDRFNEESPAGKDQLNHPYLPFGDGPRNCIGLRLGKMQTKVGLILMLQKYKYELADEHKNREMEFDPKLFLLTPKGGLRLKVFKR